MRRLPTYWLTMLFKFRRAILKLKKCIINYVTLKSAAAVTTRRVGVRMGRNVPDSLLVFLLSPMPTLAGGRSPRLISPFSGKHSVALVWWTVPICLTKSNRNVRGTSVTPRPLGGVGRWCWCGGCRIEGTCPGDYLVAPLPWHVRRHSPQYVNQRSLNWALQLTAR